MDFCEWSVVKGEFSLTCHICFILIGTKPEHFAKIAYKNHLHSVNNP